jgi:hypothetical protein
MEKQRRPLRQKRWTRGALVANVVENNMAKSLKRFFLQHFRCRKRCLSAPLFEGTATLGPQIFPCKRTERRTVKSFLTRGISLDKNPKYFLRVQKIKNRAKSSTPGGIL